MPKVIRPKTVTEWGHRYITELVKRGVSREDATNYWIQSLVWPNGTDLIAVLLDIPEEAAEFDLPFLKIERKPLE